MKPKLNFLLCILCMTMSVSAFGQNEQIDNIIAVKLTAAVGKQYYNKIALKAFTVDKNNILRPQKGFKIVYFPAEKKIVIIPNSMKLTSPKPPVPGFDISEVPGGTMFCMCGKPYDDCKIKRRVVDNTLYYDCLGYCGCEALILYSCSYPVLGYETAGGGWFNF